MATWQEKFDLTRRLNDAMNRSATSKDGQRAANVVVKLLDEKDATIAALRARLAEVECERDAAVEGKAEVFFAVEDRERLEATIARLTRALTAGVDALRVDPRDGEPWGPYKEMLVMYAIKVVEAAQREAMEEE